MNKVIWGFLILSALAFAQDKKIKTHTQQQVNCKTCHTCDVPTKQNPCLVECPRTEMVTVHQPADQSPDIIKIDQLKNKYQGVTFSHRIHAQMSEMSGGCAGCHHFNTAGPILACSDCHAEERKRDDLSKPDLQAAYHRQCINCHKEWSHSTDCNSCHLPKGTQLTQKKIKSKNHPDVKQPEMLVFETDYNKGKLVTFYHDEHTKLFGADCVSCHQKENCTRCHDKSVNKKPVSSMIPVKLKKSASEQHQPCFKCHENDSCTKCHMNQTADRFNHQIRTGWALKEYHQVLECAKCHGSTSKFTGLSRNCVSCHKDFIAGKFNHSVTGLTLDEIHIELDCGDCHTENNFAKKPDCSNCHDDKSFPKDKPGVIKKLVKK